jgi:hypothetical protein
MQPSYKFSFTSLFERMSPGVFFLLIFLYNLAMTFQGLDLSDEGFNTVFYHNIYRNPESVQYSFMFWLTGVVGGAFDYLFPSWGLWGLRMFGAIVITATCYLSYRLLRPYLQKGTLMLGLVFTVLVIANNIRIFHYNYLCMFLYMLCATFLLKGLTRNKAWLIVLAGAMVALEALARIPSLVNLGLAVAIIYYGLLHGYSWKKLVVQVILYGFGFVAGLGAMVLFMKLTNQLDTYLGAVKLVMEMGSGGASSHYGLGKLIKQFFVLYGSAVKHGLLIGLPVLACAFACNLISYRPAIRPLVVRVLTGLLLLLFVALVVTNTINHIIMVFLLADLAMLAALFIFTTGKNKELQVLTLMGLYIILTYPLGSSDGIYTVGIYTLWIGVPIAVDYFGRWSNLETDWKLQGPQPGWSFKLFLNSSQLQQIGRLAVPLILFALLYQAYYYPFFDTNDRIRMTHQVNNKYMRGVFTTKERAESINQLLQETKNYIQPGDAVLVYHSVPMIHYMTDTRPYLRNAMPWLYEGSFFANELNSTAEQTGKLPVIIRQLLKTVDDAANWPDPPARFDDNWANINRTRDEALDAFIKKYQYREVWTNQVFSILIPSKNE